MITLENFINEVDKNNLKLIQINSEENDYPNGIGSYGAINFENYHEAEIFCNRYGGEICSFRTRQGHTFWRNQGNAYKSFSYEDYLNKCNDNVYITTIKDQEERFWEQLKDIIENKDFNELLNIVNQRKENIEYMNSVEDNQIIYYDGNSDTLNNIRYTFMQFSEDVYTYAIGVYFNPNKHESEHAKIYSFIENWRVKNEYNPITLEEYNAKFRKEFNQFLDQSDFSEEIIKLNKYE
jgi:hypothetical protein